MKVNIKGDVVGKANDLLILTYTRVMIKWKERYRGNRRCKGCLHTIFLTHVNFIAYINLNLIIRPIFCILKIKTTLYL